MFTPVVILVSEAQTALALGRPREALALAQQAGEAGWGVLAVAALRLGELDVARRTVKQLPPTARRAALLARLSALEGAAGALQVAQHARQVAHQQGDAPALVSAVVILGEQQLGRPLEALRTLAEGLNVAELSGAAADTHLLAVLAHAQQRAVAAGATAAKAQRTAAKALARAQPGSPAQVWALLALGQAAQAETQRQAGELDRRWLRAASC